jgi:hypothetical protein
MRMGAVLRIAACAENLLAETGRETHLWKVECVLDDWLRLLVSVDCGDEQESGDASWVDGAGGWSCGDVAHVVELSVMAARVKPLLNGK